MLTGAHCAILNPRFQDYRPRWHVLDGIVPYAKNDTTTWTGFPQLRRRARFAPMAELPVPVERQAFWTGAQACRRSRASGVSEHLPHGHPNNRDWPRSFATSMSVRVGPSKSAPLRDVASGLAGNGHATPGSAPAGHGVDYRARTMSEGASAQRRGRESRRSVRDGRASMAPLPAARARLPGRICRSSASYVSSSGVRRVAPSAGDVRPLQARTQFGGGI